METLLVGEQEKGIACSRLCFRSDCGLFQECMLSGLVHQLFLTNSCIQVLVFVVCILTCSMYK